MIKVVWRFNLAPGVDERDFFTWLRTHVWASSAEFGCQTRAFRVEGAPLAFSTEATWPDEAARAAWSETPGFAAIPNYPGFGSPWGAQIDLERCVYREIVN